MLYSSVQVLTVLLLLSQCKMDGEWKSSLPSFSLGLFRSLQWEKNLKLENMILIFSSFCFSIFD